jgi:hypothetical protein
VGVGVGVDVVVGVGVGVAVGVFSSIPPTAKSLQSPSQNVKLKLIEVIFAPELSINPR